MKSAFSILELIFVIMIIGILAAIALPKLSVNKNDALLTKAKIEYEMINSGLALMRQNAILKNLNFTSLLDEAAINQVGVNLFFCENASLNSCVSANNCCSYSVLEKPIKSSLNGWMKVSSNQYNFNLANSQISFIYSQSKGAFECVNSKLCVEFE